jgi:hypothetical protein
MRQSIQDRIGFLKLVLAEIEPLESNGSPALVHIKAQIAALEWVLFISSPLPTTEDIPDQKPDWRS